MSYSEKGGRAGENGAPADESFGMGSFDEGSNAGPGSSKAPSFGFQPDELEQFRGNDYELIPLHAPGALDARGRKIGKAPLKGWPSADPLTVDDAQQRMAEGCNVGVRLRRCDLIVDVDPRNFEEGDDPVGRLQKDLGFRLDDYPQVVTGADGSHYYMLIPDDLDLAEGLKVYPGIEFKSYGRQVVAPGSIHPDTRKAYTWDALAVPLAAAVEAPQALLNLLRKPARTAAAEPGEISTEQLAAMLQGLDPTSYRDHTRWLELMMACHHATAGDGRDEFVGWCAGDPQYADDSLLVARRWDSLRSDPGGRSVTVRTLYKALHDVGRGDLIRRSTAEEDFDDNLPAESEPTAPERGGPTGVLNEWVYVIDAEQFVRREDGKKWKKEQWKARYASLKPDGDVLNAIWKGNLPLRKFEALVYLPGQPEFPDGELGGRYNIWRESGVTAKAGDVKPFLEHIEYLFPDEAERGFVLDYLAMLVQAPGRKINYALLVKGGQGTGKSWIGRLMTKIIGFPNVALPSNTEVMSNWTVWTEGAQLAIIEELMCVGRLDMANRLKPIITEPTLRIEAKGYSLYSIPNHLNLLAFTNHDDAVPIERGDRRWLVVFSDAKPQSEHYYERIFDFLEGDGPAAVKQWLLDRKVSLNPKGVAPRTKGKEEMQRLSLGEAEQMLAEMLEEGAPPFDCDLVRLVDVLDHVPSIFRKQKGFKNRIVKWLSDDVGAVQHGRYTKGNRPAYRLWCVRNHEKWANAGPAERVDAYERHEEETRARIR
jgi:hypothetical protein